MGKEGVPGRGHVWAKVSLPTQPGPSPGRGLEDPEGSGAHLTAAAKAEQVNPAGKMQSLETETGRGFISSPPDPETHGILPGHTAK